MKSVARPADPATVGTSVLPFPAPHSPPVLSHPCVGTDWGLMHQGPWARSLGFGFGLPGPSLPGSPAQGHTPTCCAQSPAPAPAPSDPCSGSSTTTHQRPQVTQTGLLLKVLLPSLPFWAGLLALLAWRVLTFLLLISDPPFHPHLVSTLCLDGLPLLYPQGLSFAASPPIPCPKAEGAGDPPFPPLGGCRGGGMLHDLHDLDVPGDLELQQPAELLATAPDRLSDGGAQG